MSIIIVQDQQFFNCESLNIKSQQTLSVRFGNILLTMSCFDIAGEELFFHFAKKKSRIWETKHLSTDADSSTDTTVRWT